MKRAVLAVGLSAAGLLAACSAAPVGGAKSQVAAGSRRCMGTPLQSHRVIDGQTLLIEDSWGRSALLHMASRCLLDDISPLRFVYNIGSGNICDRSDVTVSWGIDQVVPVTCITASVQPLSKEEAKAYDAPEAKATTEPPKKP